MELKGSGEQLLGLTCQLVTFSLSPSFVSGLPMQAQNLNFVLDKEVSAYPVFCVMLFSNERISLQALWRWSLPMHLQMI